MRSQIAESRRENGQANVTGTGDIDGDAAQTEPEVQAAISSSEGQPDREQAIRERASAIWEEEHRPEGSIYSIGSALKQKSMWPPSK